MGRNKYTFYLLLLFLVYILSCALKAETLTFSRQQGVYMQEGRKLKKLTFRRAEIKADKKRLVAAMLVPSVDDKKMVILPGTHAKIRTRVKRPAFLIHLKDAHQYQFALVRLRPKDTYREVSEVYISPIRRNVEKKSDLVFSHVRGLSPKVYKLIPGEPLSPGEYALARLPRVDPFDTKQVAVERDVWDFGIDPIANPKN